MVEQVLRALRLKGVANKDVLGKALGGPSDDVESRLQALVSAGLVKELARGWSLTPEGRTVLAEQLAAERATFDHQAIERLYERLCALNVQFKSLMTEWQIRSVDGVDTANLHDDPAYDAAIVERLKEIHGGMLGLLADVAAVAPRLAPYRSRFENALSGIESGDRSMMAAPIKDSYHTLWFELHEEFIDLCGRTRAGEAAAGRGD